MASDALTAGNHLSTVIMADNKALIFIFIKESFDFQPMLEEE